MLDLKALFTKFQNSYPARAQLGETLAVYIAERYEEVRTIKNRLAAIERDRAKALVAHADILSNLDSKEKDVQKFCTHPSTTYHPDASGNNDSMTTCDICGVEL